ncbi:MAG TPA: ABC transporter permease, partial [Gemmatimonadaceae bacterium]|nr:ABC transporter permease [Gemmatimonadaceae bacterium]
LADIDRRRLEHERRADWIGALGQDLRFAARTLVRSRGFATAAVLTLALGIGAATAVFGVVDGVLLRPLPYPNHERLALVWSTAQLGGAQQGELPLAAGNFLDLRGQVRSFETLAAFRAWGFTLSDAEDPELVAGARVSPALFGVLGTRPMLGRALVPADDDPGAPKVALLGHGLWQRRFGGDPGVVGRAVTLNGERYTVVGVMPPGFHFPRGAELPSGFQFPARTELWTAIAFTPEQAQRRGTFDLAVAGLLAPGVTPAQARAELSPIMRRLGDENGMAAIALGADVTPMRDFSVRSVRPGLVLLLGAVALVLVVACANVSNLLVARTAARRRELAIRTALGAGRGRLVRQLVTENLLLAAAGGALGIAVAVAAQGALLRLAPGNVPRLDDVTLDGRVLGAALLLALGIGGAFGVLAALHGGRAGGATLRDGGRTTAGAQRARLRSALVAGQLALSLVLLVGAALVVRSFARMLAVPPGFDPSGAVTAQIILPVRPDASFSAEQPRWRDVTERYLERVQTLPGVRAAGAVSSLPLTGAWESTDVGAVGAAAGSGTDRMNMQYAMVSPDYFRAMAIPMRRGRAFTTQDRADAPPVAIVSEAAAARWWPGRSPVGERVMALDSTTRTIVGVVGDVRQTNVTTPIEPAIYLPVAQFPVPFLYVVARTSADPATTVPALRRELRAVSAAAGLDDGRTLRAVYDDALAPRRFAMLIVGFFAVSTLLLAAVGLYGVVAYAVGQRTHEIGVRMALGAQTGDVMRLVLGQGLRLAALGLTAGVAGALAASGLLRRQLFEVSPVDPATYLAIIALLVAVAAAATWGPARRATRVDPVRALREE